MSTDGGGRGRLVEIRSTNDQPKKKPKPQIHVDVDIAATVDAAVKAVAPLEIYQRGGRLVDVIRESKETEAGGILRPAGAPRIRVLPTPRLREVMGEAADWTKTKTRDAKKVSIAPPKDIAATLEARGQWEGVRQLEGIVDHAVLTPDGTVLLNEGYDHQTRLIYEPSVTVVVPPLPSLQDAQQAAELLLDRVVDFPFAAPAHRSAWLAGLLTPLARSAINGPTPLLVLDANTHGAGKTLGADLIGAIALGRNLPRKSAPEEESEWRKALMSIVMAADSVVLVDNVSGKLKSAALEAVLTGTTYQDRLLGGNEMLSVPIRTFFIVTANNVTLSTDLVRRSLHARLNASENPERRTGFRWPDLIGSAIRDRAELVSAVLTILRAYVVAGRPDVSMLPMGSYDAWSRVVRAPLVWIGQADPASTQEGLRETADPERDGIAIFLRVWHETFGDAAVTGADVLRRAQDPTSIAWRDAISALVEGKDGALPTPKALGYPLRRIRDRIVDGLKIERVSEHTRAGTTWRVVSVTM